MNDRYLYRGKRIDNREWVVGQYAVARDKQGVQQHNICVPDNNLGYFKLYVVYPSTICQCTGLKDKNGNLIWENDILSGHIDDEFPENETRKRVVWYENGWCTNEYGCEDYEELGDFDSEYFEVVGNVFNNQELFK